MISFCVTTYNTSETVTEFLESFKGLKFEYEIIIVDNFSKDKTAADFRKINDSHIKVYSIKCKRGAGRTVAIQKSTGDYIVQLDADVRYFKLNKIVPMLQSNYKNKIVHVRTSGRGLNLTAGSKLLFVKLGCFPNLNTYEDIYFWRLCEKLNILSEINIEYFSLNIVRETAQGKSDISEYRYARSRYEFLKRWIEKSGDAIFVGFNSFSRFKQFNKAYNKKLLVYTTILYLLGYVYRVFFIHDPDVEKKFEDVIGTFE
jgi:glycosyltransferase involved in cell wall biosynthesis